MDNQKNNPNGKLTGITAGNKIIGNTKADSVNSSEDTPSEAEPIYSDRMSSDSLPSP
jgi:hypothetical protein